LSESQLVAFSQLTGQDVLILLDELSQFVEVLHGTPRRHRIYHASFAQFLTNSEAAGARYLTRGRVPLGGRIARIDGRHGQLRTLKH
jgi:hypothetical protein